MRSTPYECPGTETCHACGGDRFDWSGPGDDPEPCGTCGGTGRVPCMCCDHDDDEEGDEE